MQEALLAETNIIPNLTVSKSGCVNMEYLLSREL
jgi:hypothetical protein